MIYVVDCDLQHPPALVPELLAAHEMGYDVVYTVREDTSDTPLPKRVAARRFYRLVGAISETPSARERSTSASSRAGWSSSSRARIRERGLFLRGLFSWVGFPSCPLRFRVGGPVVLAA